MGTMLHRRGAPVDCCCDELNLSSPDLVKQIHEEYVNAGAQVLETNTFGGNRIRLSLFNLADELKAINAAGVKIARAAAGTRAFVAGAAGPSGVPVERSEARAIFHEQVEVLVAAG